MQPALDLIGGGRIPTPEPGIPSLAGLKQQHEVYEVKNV